MITRYKAIVCDVDGTILDGEHKIPTQLINLVAELKARGIIFTLASARPTNSMIEIAKKLNLEVPVIALNGSLIVNSEAEIIHSQQFSVSKLNQVFVKFPDLLINAYSDYSWIVNRRNPDIDTEEIFVTMKAIVSNELPEKINMLVAIGDHQILAMVQSHIYNNEPGLNAVFSHPEYLHITEEGACKANGIRKFASLYNLSMSDFMAFGDGENDISMLQMVGHGVAMANANDQVKSIADAVTDSHLELGVVTYLERYLANLK